MTISPLPLAGLPTVDQLGLTELPCHADKGRGELVVMESGVKVPFAVARVFSTRAPLGTIRGRHAHRRCSQFLVAATGAIDVRCDDASRSAQYRLDRPDRGLLVPPGIWAEIEMASEHAVLLVLCDRLYEAHDYIHDYAAFRKYRGADGREGLP